MQKLNLILKNPPGMYMLDANTSFNDVMKIAAQRGFAFFHIDGNVIENQQQFAEVAKQLMRFPVKSNDPWEALITNLHDLSWSRASGIILLYSDFQYFSHSDREHFSATMDCLRDAAQASNNGTGNPLYVLLKGHVSIGTHLLDP